MGKKRRGKIQIRQIWTLESGEIDVGPHAKGGANLAAPRLGDLGLFPLYYTTIGSLSVLTVDRPILVPIHAMQILRLVSLV